MRRSSRRTGAGTAVLLAGGLLATPGALQAADPASGKPVYELRCSPCHGDEGRGDGPAAQAIEPKPRNFRDTEFWKSRTIDQIRTVVREGKPQTLMAGFQGALSDAEIEDVIAYIQSFKPAGR
jgi:mono/diheme cytochrome c family protein